MRILLINPPDWNKVIENPDEKGEEFLEADSFGDFPPLGALEIAFSAPSGRREG